MDPLDHSEPSYLPRKTTYRHITFRSRTEARYAFRLDRKLQRSWEYEPMAFKDMTGEWLADFRINDVPTSWLGSRRVPVYVEVKYAGWWDNANEGQRRALLGRIGAIFDSVPDAVVILEESGRAPLLVTLQDGLVRTSQGAWVKGAKDWRLCRVELDDWAAA